MTRENYLYMASMILGAHDPIDIHLFLDQAKGPRPVKVQGVPMHLSTCKPVIDEKPDMPHLALTFEDGGDPSWDLCVIFRDMGDAHALGFNWEPGSARIIEHIHTGQRYHARTSTDLLLAALPCFLDPEEEKA